jgi:glutamate-5-semialdehyde dehydrogenase
MSGTIAQAAQTARQAGRVLAASSATVRDAALEAVTTALEQRRDEILEANRLDMEAAQRDGVAAPLVGRLKLEGAKFDRTVDSVASVRAQEDPLGRTQKATEIDAGLELFRVSVPIGVIGVIFESRPDALVQIASICLKSGNAVLLKGGSEAANSNRILARIISEATAAVDGIPPGWIALLETRDDVKAMLGLDQDIDLIIPRGSNEFVRYIMDNTRIPVMGHADGICHVYVDTAADLDKAVRVAVDSKVQGVSTCCAAETLLIHADIAGHFLDRAVPALFEHQVEIRGDQRVLAEVPDQQLKAANEADWSTEYLDYIYAVKVVDNLDQAIDHINRYGSHHTDSIVTEDKATAMRFLREVDAAGVFHNASTRFADGFRFGLGAEVGVSTNRLHSRGPVGMEGLTIYKYILEGDGHIVDDYEGDTPKPYSHRPLDTTWP